MFKKLFYNPRIVLHGSFNFTLRATKKNVEHLVCDTDEELFDQFEQEFKWLAES